MLAKRPSKSSSDRQNWNRIYNGLVKMVMIQQSQLETLVREKKLLEDRVRLQHDRWLSDIRLSEHRISQGKENLLDQEMASSLEALKSELFMGLKDREAYSSKWRFEQAKIELEDFRAMLKLVTGKSLGQKGKDKEINEKSSKSSMNNEQLPENLHSEEVRRLKEECDQLLSEKNSVLAEKNFVWNQYKVLEKDCESKLKSKNLKVEQAEEKVRSLISSMEHLESSGDKKEEKISKLTSQLTKIKEELHKFKEETFRLTKELDLLRNTRASLVTPVLNRCTTKIIRSSDTIGKPSNTNLGALALRKESSSVQARDSANKTGKGSKSSKRRVGEVVHGVLDSPKLFTSSFKVPKLKNSPAVIYAKPLIF